MDHLLHPPAGPRRRLLLGGAAALALGLGGPAWPADRSRARYRLSEDFAVPADTFGLVP